MHKIGRFLSRAVGWLGDIQAVWAIIPASIVSAVSGLSGYQSDGLGWALFMASGAFVFVSMGIILIRESYRANRLEHKLNVSEVWVQQIPDNSGLVLFRPNFRIQSSANFDVFFEVTDADYTFGPVKGALDKTVPLRGLLAPRESVGILIPAAVGYPPLAVGRIRIQVKYGREKNAYSYVFETILECSALTIVPVEEGGLMAMTRLVQNLDYSRIRS